MFIAWYIGFVAMFAIATYWYARVAPTESK
jgi:hypothetical protein